jgi:membrane-bound lytic murein transglycosylase B
MIRERILACALLWVSAGVLYAQVASEGVSLEPPRPSFDQWLDDLRAEAVARGYATALVERALGAVERLPAVVQSDRSQAERTLPIPTYVARRVTPAVVRTAHRMADSHRELLARVAGEYGVPAPIVVAIWGLESNFGTFSGARPTLAALATLAYDRRRAAFFRAQLFDVLTIIDRGDIELERLRGSWAGAMGQPQFLPSSYLRYAVDFDRDGRRDIWRSHGDVFASIANYLAEHGWRRDERWGRQVRVPAAAWPAIEAAVPLRRSGCEAKRRMTEPLPLEDWRALGVTRLDGRPLPLVAAEGSLVRAGSTTFLVYKNYDAVLAYNCAHTYALSVGTLADRLTP